MLWIIKGKEETENKADRQKGRKTMRGKEKTHIDQGADTQTLPPTPPPNPKKELYE